MKVLSKKNRAISVSSFIAASAAFSLMLSACGDDSSSSNNVEREENSSSSVEEISSSSETSSSSVEEISDLPKGYRAATLEDLGKYHSLPLFGTEIYLATGSKKGVFSLWDSGETGWVAFRSDFKNGILEFSEESRTGDYLGGNYPVADSLSKMYKSGAKIQIIVNEKDGSLQYSLNDGDYANLPVAKIAELNSILTSGDKLKGKALSCKQDSTTFEYSFFEGRYIAEAGDEWEAGFYDVQYGRLLMIPTFLGKASYQALVTMNVSADLSSMVNVVGGELSCKVSELKSESVDSELMAGDWVADGDGYDWKLSLAETGKYSLVAKKMNSAVLNNSGSWDVYGNILLIKNTACTDPSACLTSIKGSISDFDPSKGFKLEHSNTEEPIMPSAWSAPQY